MPELILYSTNTWLAFNIATRYFNNEHYVWCTPFFDSDGHPGYAYTVAATSCPKEIYLSLMKEVIDRDNHSSKIKDNKVGILKGAAFKRAAGVITEDQEKEIASVVDNAVHQDFKPLLYVIPYDKVLGLLKNVPIAEKAHPLSAEFIIESLPRDHFDIIELERK